MPGRDLLSEEEIAYFLISNPCWSRDGNKIIRELSLADFPSAIGMINSIAFVAEKMDHHPDILLYGWNKLRLTLYTHDSGGLTELDFRLAKKIDNLAFTIVIK
jgi:4a-hydroxytetrahydrobiopterin dehydratase